jgi:EAL domain-containing protein (putative c-di-GMP-specific phosphodiesterase class I)
VHYQPQVSLQGGKIIGIEALAQGDKNLANTKIVKAIIALARGLGIVAEGAETNVELSWLNDLGCPAVRGYGIAFPMPGSQAEAWLATHSAGPQRRRRVTVAAGQSR